MNNNELFFANLRGSEEVPPVQTDAFGLAKFKVSKDERKIGYRLTVNNLSNFTQAHIHMGRRGVNGQVVVFLFGPADPDISVNKGVVEGIITADDLVGPLEGKPLSALLDLMRDRRNIRQCPYHPKSGRRDSRTNQVIVNLKRNRNSKKRSRIRRKRFHYSCLVVNIILTPPHFFTRREITFLHFYIFLAEEGILLVSRI